MFGDLGPGHKDRPICEYRFFDVLVVTCTQSAGWKTEEGARMFPTSEYPLQFQPMPTCCRFAIRSQYLIAGYFGDVMAKVGLYYISTKTSL